MTVWHTCPDCKNKFAQEFRCITCGAQKLYDATVRSQELTIQHLRTSLAKWGDHASNCAYRLAHYKGPVPDCDCGWNQYVLGLTANDGEGVNNGK